MEVPREIRHPHKAILKVPLCMQGTYGQARENYQSETLIITDSLGIQLHMRYEANSGILQGGLGRSSVAINCQSKLWK